MPKTKEYISESDSDSDVEPKPKKQDKEKKSARPADSGSDSDSQPKSKKQHKEKKPAKPSDSGSDSDSEPKPKKKKEKAKTNVSPDGEVMLELGRMKYATVQEFKGKRMVNIREFYEKDGELKPGRKGIALSEDQWSKLKKNVRNIDEALDDL